MKYETISNFQIGSFTFNASFDSGNLGRIDLVKPISADLIDKQNVIVTPPQNASPGGSSAEGANSQATSSSGPKEKQIDAEFNLWTRPDCHGTPFENSNRTWFYFSVRGGEKNQTIKLNVMNLNKQAKLFSQGMNTVVKHGTNGKWERMKEKPMFYATDENFILSFYHRTYENIEDNLTFYAFTFPFTYTELMELLESYDKKHEKSPEELEITVRELNGPRKDKIVININENVNQDYTMDDEVALDGNKEMLDVVTEDANSEVPTRDSAKEFFRARSSHVADENTSESMQQLSNLVNNVKIEKMAMSESVMSYIAQDVRTRLDEVRDDIYYYRELLINSFEQRRIDLLTISSFHGIEDKREERLKNLFPDYSKPRCHNFKDKKIIFISSRVHPGETPASFVLNGFVNLLLDRKNQVAAILRKMYVFKIVPFLNPDGVYNGLYRSDTLGHNLNRVYLNPRLDTQPSIYAVRKLIRFYHFGCDKPDLVDEVGQPVHSDDCVDTSLMNFDDQQQNEFEFAEHEFYDKNLSAEPDVAQQPSSTSEQDRGREPQRTQPDEGTKAHIHTDIFPQILPKKDVEEHPVVSLKRSDSALNIFDQTTILKLFSAKNWTETFFNRIFRKKFLVISPGEEQLMMLKNGFAFEQQLMHISQFRTRDFLPAIAAERDEKLTNDIEMAERSSDDSNDDKPKTNVTAVNLETKVKRRCASQPAVKSLVKLDSFDGKSKSKASTSYNKLKETATNVKNMVSKDKKTSAKGDAKNKTNQATSSGRHQHHHYKHFISHYNSEKQQRVVQQQYFSQQPHQGLNISMDFRVQTDENGDKSIVEESSNLFLYLDLHGHASKKGVFMYGNHLNNTQEAVEVMLLPRLMSMNCHHFAFDACNFSERNMYLKGKRDGLSKEGSGRVAVYKSTGLIKSYTLESNYNMSKCVNILPPKGKDLSCKVHNLIPPKFTPAIFEEVGRALGPSLLDLTGSNPTSRIINSEFRSLQGLRNSLKNEISRGLSKARVSKFTKANKKRQTTLTLPTASAQDMLKENKVTSPSNSSSSHISSNQQPTSLSKTQTMSQGAKILGTKIKPIGKIQAFSKKDVNVLASAKKKKVLCEASLTAASSIQASTVAGSLVNQIPRKKIKVSNVGGSNTFMKGDASSSNLITTSTQPSEHEIKFFAKTLDDEMTPCCSKNLSSFLKAPPSPSGSSTSSGQLKITNFLPIKKLTKTRKIKFGKPAVRIGGSSLKKLSSMMSSDSQSNVALSLDTAGTSQALSPSSKLLKKKKRSLKSERKKSRSQKPLLH